MNDHEIIKGSCGHVIAQCRCPGQGLGPKPVRIVRRKCYACSNPPAYTAQKPDVKEQPNPLDASWE